MNFPKNLLFIHLFLSLAVGATAQDFSKVMLLSQTKKYKEAKKEIDEILTNENAKTNPEAYLWKATVYGDLYADKTLSGEYPDALITSYTAFTKYKELQPDLKLLRENTKVLGALYGTSFEWGKTYFQQSKWDASYRYFKIAEEMGEFINKNSLGTNKSTIDTFTVLYTGYSAQNAGKMADAIVYYEKLAALKINGMEFLDMYRYMLDYYEKNKKADKFKQTLAIAKELYPDQSAIWNQTEMANLTSSSSLGEVLAKYKADEAGGRLTTADQYLGYAGALATTDQEQLKSLDAAKQAELKMVAADAFKKAFAKEANGVYAYNAGVMYYAIFNALDEKLYGLSGDNPDLQAKREALEKQKAPAADQAIEWLEKAYGMLKTKADRNKIETTCLNRSVDNLANLYSWKRDMARDHDSEVYNAMDAKYKIFNSEHEKYQ